MSPIVAGARDGLDDFVAAARAWCTDEQLRLAELVSARLESTVRPGYLGPYTIVHGDYRLDNLMFRPDGSVVVLDWQMVAAAPDGAADILLLLASSMDGARRRLLLDELLARYCDALARGGVRWAPDQLRPSMQRTLALCVGRMIVAHRLPSPNARAVEMRRRLYDGYWDLADTLELADLLELSGT